MMVWYWQASWKKFLIDMMYLRGHVTLYPNFPNQTSFSTNHMEPGAHIAAADNVVTHHKEDFEVPLLQVYFPLIYPVSYKLNSNFACGNKHFYIYNLVSLWCDSCVQLGVSIVRTIKMNMLLPTYGNDNFNDIEIWDLLAMVVAGEFLEPITWWEVTTSIKTPSAEPVQPANYPERSQVCRCKACTRCDCLQQNLNHQC